MNRAALAWAAAFFAASSMGPAWAADAPAAACAAPQQVQGFETCADLQKAEQEGAVVIYSPDVEQGTASMLEAFHALFPKIKTNYLRLQTGALYAKIQAERQAHTYDVDVINLSDIGLALDFQKRGGYARYLSPQFAAYKPAFLSQPAGDWTWGSIIIAGIAYNPHVVPPAEAPKTWKDLLDPKWAGAVSVKSTNSGLQHVTWYELTRLYGASYWQQFAKQEPRVFDSYVQQFDRLSNGQDKVASTAQYSGVLQFKAKGAPIDLTVPPDGMPAGPEVWGVVNNAPHPEAGKLFLDWFLSPLGQKATEDALFMHSAREDVPPPPGGVPITKIKLLIPSDWQKFLASRPDFLRAWDSLAGMR